MAAGYFKQFVLTQDVRRISICGKIKLDSSGNVVSFTNFPKVLSVVKTGTGTYVVTMQTPFVSLQSATFGVQTTQVGVSAQMTNETTSTASSPQIFITTVVAGAAANVTAATLIHCQLEFRDSGVPEVG